jgi:hypothetical protein
MIPAKEFLERMKKRNNNPPPITQESESDKYYDALGEVIEQYPITKGIKRRSERSMAISPEITPELFAKMKPTREVDPEIIEIAKRARAAQKEKK